MTHQFTARAARRARLGKVTARAATAPARDLICSRLGIPASSSNEQVFAALDERLTTSLAAKAGWVAAATSKAKRGSCTASGLDRLALKAGWGA